MIRVLIIDDKERNARPVFSVEALEIGDKVFTALEAHDVRVVTVDVSVAGTALIEACFPD